MTRPSVIATLAPDEVDALHEILRLMLRGGDAHVIARTDPGRRLQQKVAAMKAQLAAERAS